MRKDDTLKESGEPAPTGEGSRRPRRRRVRSGDVFLLIVVLLFVVVVLVLAFKPDQVFLTLYNKTAGLILIIMVVEYLVLKSMDRTRVYELENKRLRENLRLDRQIMKRAKELLADRLRQPPPPTPNEADARWRTRAESLVEEIGGRL